MNYVILPMKALRMYPVVLILKKCRVCGVNIAYSGEAIDRRLQRRVCTKHDNASYDSFHPVQRTILPL